MRHRADRTIRKTTNGGYHDTQQYFDSTNASSKQTSWVSDYGEDPVHDNYEEIKTQLAAKTEEEFQARSQVTADSLLNRTKGDTKEGKPTGVDEISTGSQESVRVFENSIEYDITEKREERGDNGQLRTSHQDRWNEHWGFDDGTVRVIKDRNEQERDYYANHRVKSKTDKFQCVMAESDLTNDKIKEVRDSENKVSFNKSGTIKEAESHSINYGKYRTDSYCDGQRGNPTELVSGHADNGQVSVERYHNPHLDPVYRDDSAGASYYSATVSDGEEKYTYRRNNRECNVSRDSEGNLLAVRTVMKNDAIAARDTLERIASEHELRRMRQRADRAVRTITNGEYENMQQYQDSFKTFEGKDPSVLSDWVNDPISSKHEEIQQQLTETKESKLDGKSEAKVGRLLQKKLQNCLMNR